MTNIRCFTIPGPVKGKGRHKFARRGNFVTTYTPKETVSYENLVKMCYTADHPGAPMIPKGVPVAVTIMAYFPIPQSWSKRKKAEAHRHTSKPDCDNIEKLICDALNGIAWYDDSQCVPTYTDKLYTAVEPQCFVTMEWQASDQAAKEGR